MDRSCFVDKLNGVEVIRIKTPQTKDVGYVRRTIAEILMPFCMLYKIQKIPGLKLRWDGIIWYSPTIFLGPVVKALKLKNKCKAYLIVRDIFPDWAVDMGLMRKNGLPYCFFSAVAKFQYSLADTIGIQTKGNEKYFTEWLSRSDGRLEILQNWSTVASKKACSLSLKNTPLAEQRVFVYAGNMGIAQGMGVLMELAEKMIDGELDERVLSSLLQKYETGFPADLLLLKKLSLHREQRDIRGYKSLEDKFLFKHKFIKLGFNFLIFLNSGKYLPACLINQIGFLVVFLFITQS